MTRKSSGRWLTSGSLFLALLITLAIQERQARAVGLGSLVKVGSIAVAVSLFGKDINNFINKLYQRHGVAAKESTKVVAILSIGKGTHLGAAQVIGPKDRVRSVQAVAQGEAELGPGRAGGLRLRALLPIATKSISTGKMKSVGGVGVGALIDFKL